MKKTIILFLLFSGVTSISNSQEIEIEKIILKENKLEGRIKKLQDSLIGVKEIIAFYQAQEEIKNTNLEPIKITINKGGKLRQKPFPSSDILMRFKKNTEVQLIGHEDRYFQICLNNTKCGYVSHLWIESSTEIRKFVSEFEELKKLKNKTSRLAEEKRIEIKSSERRRRWDSIDKKREIRNAEREKEILAKKKLEEKEILGKYGKEIFTKLKKGMYWIGMNKEQLTFSLGWPDDINRSVGSWGTNEQFIYNENLYIYLENGKVTSYQN